MRQLPRQLRVRFGLKGSCSSPAADEIARARRIIAAYEEASGTGRGAVRIDGRLVEALHVEEARRTLALVQAIAEPEVG